MSVRGETECVVFVRGTLTHTLLSLLYTLRKNLVSLSSSMNLELPTLCQRMALHKETRVGGEEGVGEEDHQVAFEEEEEEEEVDEG